MHCRFCGSEVTDAADACPSCGTLFPALAVDAFEGADLDRTPESPNGLPGDLAAAAPTAQRPAGESATEIGGGPPEIEASRFLPGSVLAERYRIVSLLGKGAMGEVYRADDLKLAMPVALKFLPEAQEHDQGRMARFLGEVKIARQVTHPNVCRVFDVGEVDGHPFLSMEYIDGEDLASLLRRIGRLPGAKAAELGREMAGGLAAVHREGILHRDLKPANLMIDGRGRARITDFGIAGLAESIHGAEVSVGTPAYMSPEQFAGEEVSVRSDLYALGLVLYELFTGQRAFDGSSLEVLAQRRQAAPAPPTSVVEGLDPAVERVILRCLERNPRDRPSSAEAVAAALAEGESGAVLKALVASELLGREHWGGSAAELARRHGRIVRRLLDEHGGRETAGAHGGLAVFERPIAAVSYALAYHRAVAEWSGEEGREITARVGIHLGEIVLPEDAATDGETSEVEGAARTTVVRLAALAVGRQTLLTRGAFDLARQSAAADDTGLRRAAPDGNLRWLAHGAYTTEGLTESREIFEVGVEGAAPLVAPAESGTVRRVAGQETILGWRPAPGLALPQRPHWVVERKLGEGGFGEVWLAAHEKTHERRVFKFCYQARSLRALQREITVFRLLKEELGERDDITRVLDWNFERAPYFIESEYTAGGSLVEWGEEQGGLEQVPLATRLEILAQVADALAAAHSVGVLHKDVKPANVLITTDQDGHPRAKLTDFGVGLITDRERLAKAGITVLGMTVMMDETKSSEVGTRLYMAPEVVEGKAATVEADIYALGVMLYQLVTEDFSHALAPGWRRDVEDELLCDDIAVAVDGSPERRLGNARRLAERLRSLEGRREAREAERRGLEERERERREAEEAMAALERARKRRKLVLAAVAMLALFAAVMAFQARRIAHEAERAEREAEASRQVSDFLVELFEVSDPYAAGPQPARGDEITAREILDRGAEKIEKELDNQPEIQARLMHTIGVVYLSLNLFDAAAPLLEGALALRRQVYGDEQLEVAESLHVLAKLANAKSDYEGSEALYREALAMRRRLLGDEHVEVAETLYHMAVLLEDLGDLDGAELHLREALAMRRQLLGDEHTDVALSLVQIGSVLQEKGDYEAAEPPLREGLALQRRLLGDEHPTVAYCMFELAKVLWRKDDLEAAEPLIRDALEMQRRLMGNEHGEVLYGLHMLAVVLMKKGDYEGAEAAAREALALTRQLFDGASEQLASGLYQVGRALWYKGDYEGAASFHRKALDLRREILGDEHYDVATDLITLAIALDDKGDLEDAEPLYREALAMYRRLLGTEHPYVAHTQAYLGGLLRKKGDVEAAEALIGEALELHRRIYGEQSLSVAEDVLQLAEIMLLRGDLPAAESHVREALEVRRNSLPAGHWEIAHAESVLGAALSGLGRYGEAEALLLSAYPILRERRSERAPFTRDALERIVALYEAWGKPEKAAEYRALLPNLNRPQPEGAN